MGPSNWLRRTPEPASETPNSDNKSREVSCALRMAAVRQRRRRLLELVAKRFEVKLPQKKSALEDPAPEVKRFEVKLPQRKSALENPAPEVTLLTRKVAHGRMVQMMKGNDSKLS